MAYSPSAIVKAGHGIPHLSRTLKSVDNSFLQIESNRNEYLESIIILPGIFVAAGILSLLIYQLILCFRCCCPLRKNIMPQPKSGCCFCWTITRNNPKTLLSFFFVIILAMLSNLCVFIGSSSFSSSIDHAGNAIVGLSDLLQSIADVADSMVATGTTISSIIDSANCSGYYDTYASDVSSYISSSVNAAGNVSSAVGSFPSTLLDSEEALHSYTASKDMVVYIYFAIIAFIILMLMISSCCQSKVFLNLWILVTEVVILALTVLSGVEMVLVTFLADFCYDPTGNILGMPIPSSASDVVSYYIQCTGTSPFASDIANMTTSLSSLNETVTDTSSLIPAACYLGSEVTALTVDLAQLVYDVSCSPIYAVYQEGIEVSLCTDAYKGFFTIWLTHFITAGTLYFTLIMVSQFHDIFKATGATMHDDDSEGHGEDTPVAEFELVETREADAPPAAVAKPGNIYWDVEGYTK